MYTNFQYPWPCDPPRVPESNPTGCYLCSFALPAAWRQQLQRNDARYRSIICGRALDCTLMMFISTVLNAHVTALGCHPL